MLRILIIVIGVLTAVSCSVLVMNHSNGNVVRDDTEPVVKTDIDADIKYKPRDTYIDTIK